MHALLVRITFLSPRRPPTSVVIQPAINATHRRRAGQDEGPVEPEAAREPTAAPPHEQEDHRQQSEQAADADHGLECGFHHVDRGSSATGKEFNPWTVASDVVEGQ